MKKKTYSNPKTPKTYKKPPSNENKSQQARSDYNSIPGNGYDNGNDGYGQQSYHPQQNYQNNSYQLNEDVNHGNQYINPQGNFNPHMGQQSVQMSNFDDMQMAGGIQENQINYSGDSAGGENVMVACRVRPFQPFEFNRGDECCLKVVDDFNIQVMKNNAMKHYRFNRVLDERCSQADVFHLTNIPKLLDSSLDGYAATLFAYGQTGSGKTYTIAGNENKMGQDNYVSDESEGIIPRSVRYLWQTMAQRNENFYVKSSFLEIYNEQLKDQLNPGSGNLQCRWNIQNGFFVEDLMVVECTNVDDMIAVQNEGMKHRRVGAHELNKDSSRSHSILTIYLITEMMSNGQAIRKYGKISFVDLAGSERLKESKSKGEMILETQKINKSLFTLGKVISYLSDKKKATPYVPYRDSKLTMLLMDSLGGKAKALMMSCISPSGVYYDETLSTLNYATRTMNIKNKPIMQMDQREMVIYNLTKENDQLKMENQFQREQLQRANNGLPIELPDNLTNNGKKQLPPLRESQKRLGSSGSRKMETDDKKSLDMPYNKVQSEYEYELGRLKTESDEMRNARDLAEKNYQIVMNDNNALSLKLENLENVFIGNPILKGSDANGKKFQSDEYMTSNLLAENSELKNQIVNQEEKNFEMNVQLKEKSAGMNLMAQNVGDTMSQVNELMRMKNANGDLQKRVEYLQMRERDLLDQVVKTRNGGAGGRRPPSNGSESQHA